VTLVKRLTKPMNQSVAVHIGEFSVIALGGESGDGSEPLEARLTRAIALYVHDKDSAKLGWAYPVGLPTNEGGQVELKLSLGQSLWREFEREAKRQGVSVSKLASHAALYYAAEVDAGRITQRILDRIDEERAGAEVEESSP
jgi:hypothetical protein